MTVVVAYSADQFGHAAVEHGAREALAQKELLVVVNASTGQKLVDSRFAPDEEIRTLTAGLEAQGLEVEIRHDVVADVADAVLAAARESGARLVVVGIRKRTPVGKLIMGSVAQRVILDADCPVLAVKP
ncbi:universal stress protein [Nocardioides dongxiaopingii]|uniref:universal stress protein n=1 Tax=Nocardioides TaxID=1839 RepID=UPI0010C769AF|nr:MULTISPECIES: universal stress protein [Nocardioides]QCW49914.1 universal stress protein [Nocardioides sp. S-1144]